MQSNQNELDVESILANFREMVGSQAQEIVVLKSIISSLEKKLAEMITPEVVQDK